jgi:hypothetical protein
VNAALGKKNRGPGGKRLYFAVDTDFTFPRDDIDQFLAPRMSMGRLYCLAGQNTHHARTEEFRLEAVRIGNPPQVAAGNLNFLYIGLVNYLQGGTSLRTC